MIAVAMTAVERLFSSPQGQRLTDEAMRAKRWNDCRHGKRSRRRRADCTAKEIAAIETHKPRLASAQQKVDRKRLELDEADSGDGRARSTTIEASCGRCSVDGTGLKPSSNERRRR